MDDPDLVVSEVKRDGPNRRWLVRTRDNDGLRVGQLFNLPRFPRIGSSHPDPTVPLTVIRVAVTPGCYDCEYVVDVTYGVHISLKEDKAMSDRFTEAMGTEQDQCREVCEKLESEL